LKSPETTRNCIGISSSVEILVLKGFRSKRTGLRIIARLEELNIGIIRASGIVFNSDIGRQVEVGIKSASAMTAFDRCDGGELVDVVVAGSRTIETGLDTVAFVPDLRECEIDFGDDTGDVEAFDVADAAAVAGLETRADFRETVVVAGLDWGCRGSSGEDGKKSEEE
jgi:hypothetical protein